MANVLITSDQKVDDLGCCAYCNEPSHDSRDVTMRCLSSCDSSILYRLTRVLSADPRFHWFIVPAFLGVVFVAIYGGLSIRIPVIRESWFSLVALPIVLLLTPVWRSIATSWTREELRLPLCANHFMSDDKIVGEWLKLPAWISLLVVLCAGAIYAIGVALGLLDPLDDDILLLGFAPAILFLAVYAFVSVWVTWRRTRFGIRQADDAIELWHCSDRFREELANQALSLVVSDADTTPGPGRPNDTNSRNPYKPPETTKRDDD